MRIEFKQPLSGQLFHIDETGRMPSIRCEACLLDADNQVVKTAMQWELKVVENILPAACASAKLGRQMVSLQGMSAGIGAWVPAWNTAVGGEALLSVRAEHAGQVYEASVNFRIRGRNPSPDAVVERLGGKNSPAAWLASYLSGLKQFDIQGMPNFAENGSVGIMRLCDPAAKQFQRWSWVQNADAGKALLQRAEGMAKAHLDQHRIDGTYRNQRQLNDPTVLLFETLQRYLGGGYWEWDEQHQHWQASPPDDRVERLIQVARKLMA